MEVKVLKCDKCGNIVEMLHEGPGAMSCCGEEMKLIVENTVDAAREKHVPVIEKIDGGIRVTVGSVEHPMLDAHFIQWIEVITENMVLRAHLKPGEKPVAEFKIDNTQKFYVREYCNLHGLWKAE